MIVTIIVMTMIFMAMGIEMEMKVVFMMTIVDLHRLLIRLRPDIRHIIHRVLSRMHKMLTVRRRHILRCAHLPLRCSYPRHRLILYIIPIQNATGRADR